MNPDFVFRELIVGLGGYGKKWGKIQSELHIVRGRDRRDNVLFLEPLG